MACDAKSVETLLVNTDKYYQLSQRQGLEWLAQLVTSIGSLTVTQAINLAASNKMAALSDRQLEECRLAVFTAALYDAQTLVTEMATQKYATLDRHDLLCAAIAAYCGGSAGSAQTVENLSVGDGYFKLSERDDDVLALDAVICDANSTHCTSIFALHLRGGITGMSERHLKEIICACINNVATPQPPGSFTAVPQSDGSIVVTWPTPGGGVGTTQVWISTDGGVTFTQVCTVAAPGTTCTVPNQGNGVTVIVEVRQCNSAGNCGPFTGTSNACTIIIGGIGASDDFESYANAAPLNGLNGGTGWCNSLAVQPYADKTGYLGMLAQDDFESYANNAALLGLNGGTGAWNGAYGDNNVSVQLNALNEWPTNASTTTIVATASAGVPAYSYQWNKNGVALTNAGHYSGVTTATLTITGYTAADDANYTCTVTDTTARSYTSLACTTLVAATNAQLWASVVAQTNGGAWPSQNTVTAFDTFDAAITTAGIKSRLYHVNLVAPDSLTAALTPFIATFGFTYYGSHAHNAQAGGGTPSLTVNGLQSGASAGTDHCTVWDTGVSPSAIPSFSAANMGLSIYVFGPVAGGTPNYNMGYVSDVAGNRPALATGINNVSGGFSFNGLETAGIDIAFNGTGGGFVMASRTASNVHTAYQARSNLAWGSVGTGNTNNTQGPLATTLGFGGNQAQENTGHWYGSGYRFSFWACHDGFSSADGQALFNAVQACRVSLGGGFN